jgi:hypothetical protein
MLGTIFRVLILRVLGGRAAAVLAVLAMVFGWRKTRAERRLDQENGRISDRPGVTDPTRVDRPAD